MRYPCNKRFVNRFPNQVEQLQPARKINDFASINAHRSNIGDICQQVKSLFARFVRFVKLSQLTH